MVAQHIGFGVIAFIMAVGAIRVVTTRNVMHAALWLVLVLAGVAAQFILLSAEFVAATQLLVYIGAVIVLFLFGIMLTRAPMHPDENLGTHLVEASDGTGSASSGYDVVSAEDTSVDPPVGDVLRTYRLALLTDPTYAAYFGPDNVTAVLVRKPV